MKVLVIGSGGREHALVWKIAQSPLCTKIYCAPGNAGIAQDAECIAINTGDIDGLVQFSKTEKIDLVVIGPEEPLVKGLADRLTEKNINVFGPTQAAARLEGSKAFMKDFCVKYGIPTASYGQFTDFEAARSFIADVGGPLVVKADGLAAGKGVIICKTQGDAEKAAENMLSGGLFGEAGAKIVIERFLEGQELSFFALSDGKNFVSLASAQDHKRAFDGDKGPNTGGMGAYSPACMMTPALEKKIIDRIIRPTIDGMAAEGCPFSGVLFAGIMLVKGEPVLLEFNTRFGDPECQALMMRFSGDFLKLIHGCATGTLTENNHILSWLPDPSLCVVMAAKGYPDSYAKGTVIARIHETAYGRRDVQIFHAGTAQDDNGQFVNTGGRVLGVTATGKTIEEARDCAYDTIGCIDWPQGFYRSDIGWQALAAEQKVKTGTSS